MFADLNAELEKLPDVAVVAVGGLPIVWEDDHYTLCGAPISPESLRSQLVAGLGLGAVLTHRNPNNKTLTELGELCLGHKHLWTAHVLLLTLSFDACPLSVRNAFAFDRRFHLSWVEREVNVSLCTFTATASVREWHRLMGYANETSFNDEQRAWFANVQTLLASVVS